MFCSRGTKSFWGFCGQTSIQRLLCCTPAAYGLLKGMQLIYLLEASVQYKGGIEEGDTVLVTAAAGGTGHFAVQIAKLKGCHTIATCGSKAKADKLRAIGADRIINYREEVSLTDLNTRSLTQILSAN